MRQQKFNEMLSEALTDSEIQQQVRALLQQKKAQSVEELKQQTEPILARTEQEMKERAPIIAALKAEHVVLSEDEPQVDSEKVMELKQALQSKQTELEESQKQAMFYSEQLAKLQADLQAATKQKHETEQRLAEEKQQLLTAQQQIEQLQKQAHAASEQRQCAEQRLGEQQQQTTFYAEQLRNIQQQFLHVLAAYSDYEQLAADTKARLAGIVKGDSVETFLYCGVQYENIDPLWEMIKREIIEERLADVPKLEAIFSFFLQAHNSIYASPLFMRITVTIGEPLDEDLHIRTSNGRVAGNVQQLYLAGYRNVKMNKLVKKSVVLV